jgi:hypothetical protein
MRFRYLFIIAVVVPIAFPVLADQGRRARARRARLVASIEAGRRATLQEQAARQAEEARRRAEQAKLDAISRAHRTGRMPAPIPDDHPSGGAVPLSNTGVCTPSVNGDSSYWDGTNLQEDVWWNCSDGQSTGCAITIISVVYRNDDPYPPDGPDGTTHNVFTGGDGAKCRTVNRHWHGASFFGNAPAGWYESYGYVYAGDWDPDKQPLSQWYKGWQIP